MSENKHKGINEIQGYFIVGLLSAAVSCLWSIRNVLLAIAEALAK